MRFAAMILVLACVPLIGANAQSMDEINAGIRARAAATKGQEPQKLNLTTNGTTEKTAKQIKEEQETQEIKKRGEEMLNNVRDAYAQRSARTQAAFKANTEKNQQQLDTQRQKMDTYNDKYGREIPHP